MNRGKWRLCRRDYTPAGATLPSTDNPNDPILSLQAPINIGDPSESNVLLAQVTPPTPQEGSSAGERVQTVSVVSPGLFREQ